MGLVKITFDGSSVSAKQDADLNYHINGMVADGVLKGLGNGLTVSTSNNYIIFSSGYVQIYGRRIFVEQNTQIYISLDSTKYGYVIIDVDLTTNTVNLSKAESSSGYPTLTQQNLSKEGTRYQMAIAKYSKTSSSLTLDTSFKPTQIDTPLSVANDGYNRAVSYFRNNCYCYAGKASQYSQELYLSTAQANKKNDTYFIAKMSTGQIIGFPGFDFSGLSNYSCSYCDGGTTYSVVIGYSESSRRVSFTCSNKNHYVAYVYGLVFGD